MPSDEYSIAKHYLSRAIDKESEDFLKAKEYYVKAIQHFDNVIAVSLDSETVQHSLKFRASALERIRHIDCNVPAASHDHRSSLTENVQPRSSKESILRALRHIDRQLVEQILNEVLEAPCTVKFADIAGNEKAKAILNETLILPLVRPDIFKGIRSPAHGILFFGPPGNGKTMMAKAVASEGGCTFFNITAASLFSKWFGQSENLVRALFAVARHLQPSVIFFDEVDAILTARGKGHETCGRVLTQLLAEMDGVNSGSERVVILAATNRPQDLDDAALRRLPRRLYIRLPDYGARLMLLQKFITEFSHALSTVDVQKIADNTEGYSASELRQLAREASMRPIREIPAGKLRNLNCNSIRPVVLDDFVISLRVVRPATLRDKLSAFEEWNDQFGEYRQYTEPVGSPPKYQSLTLNLL